MLLLIILLSFLIYISNNDILYNYEIIWTILILIIILFLLGNIIGLPITRCQTRDTILEIEAFKETVSNYKDKNGVYYLNQNSITIDEYKKAVEYNKYIKQTQYWNSKPYFDVFYTDDINNVKPILFIRSKK
jgi:hypothetical protein